MFSNVFPSPYVDIIKLFEKNWEKAEFSGDVQLAIDQAIGKKVFFFGGCGGGCSDETRPDRPW